MRKFLNEEPAAGAEVAQEENKTTENNDSSVDPSKLTSTEDNGTEQNSAAGDEAGDGAAETE
jgi:hypothetical protein